MFFGAVVDLVLILASAAWTATGAPAPRTGSLGPMVFGALWLVVAVIVVGVLVWQEDMRTRRRTEVDEYLEMDAMAARLVERDVRERGLLQQALQSMEPDDWERMFEKMAKFRAEQYAVHMERMMRLARQLREQARKGA